MAAPLIHGGFLLADDESNDYLNVVVDDGFSSMFRLFAKQRIPF